MKTLQDSLMIYNFMSLSPPRERHDEIVPRPLNSWNLFFVVFHNSTHLIVFRQNINAIINFIYFNEIFIR